MAIKNKKVLKGLSFIAVLFMAFWSFAINVFADNGGIVPSSNVDANFTYTWTAPNAGASFDPVTGLCVSMYDPGNNWVEKLCGWDIDGTGIQTGNFNDEFGNISGTYHFVIWAYTDWRYCEAGHVFADCAAVPSNGGVYTFVLGGGQVLGVASGIGNIGGATAGTIGSILLNGLEKVLIVLACLIGCSVLLVYYVKWLIGGKKKSFSGTWEIGRGEKYKDYLKRSKLPF